MKTIAVFYAVISICSCLAQERFPLPPGINKPWSANFDDDFKIWLKPVSIFFDRIGADPRGLEYREVELQMGSIWSGDAGTHKTHAWVYKSPSDTAQVYALTWNAQVYPALWVGDLQDLNADAQLPDTVYNSLNPDITEEKYSVDYRSVLSPVKIAMLLRLGMIKPAQALQKKYTAWHQIENDIGHDILNRWMGDTYERGIMAHMRADDATALHCFSYLDEVLKWVNSDESLAPGLKGDLEYMSDVPELYADQLRRKADPFPFHCTDFTDTSDEHSRKISMIRALENIDGKMMGQPGGVMFSWLPDVTTIKKEGPAVVDFLIDCMETDKRLTRTIYFWRDFVPSRDVFSVAQVAEIIIEDLLEINYNDILPTEKEVCENEDIQCRARVWRKYWQQNRNLPLAALRFNELNDDNQKPEVWSDAAEYLTVTGGKPWSYTQLTPHHVIDPEARDTLIFNGDRLAPEMAAEITPLFRKRIQGLLQLAENEESCYHAFVHLRDAQYLLKYFARWDLMAAKEDMRAGADLLYKLYSGCPDISENHYFVLLVNEFVILSHECGNEETFQNYAAFMKSLPPSIFSEDYTTMSLSPLTHYSNAAEIRSLTDWLFSDSLSPVLGYFASNPERSVRLFKEYDGLPIHGLMLYKSFRDWTIELLRNKMVISSADYEPDGSYHIRGGAYVSQSGTATNLSPDYPKTETHRELRICDYVAEQVGQLTGTRALFFYQDDSSKDSIISEQINFLQVYGHHYKCDDKGWFLFDIPELQRPATRQDVSAGAAVFAFSEFDSVRRVPLDRIPVREVSRYHQQNLQETVQGGVYPVQDGGMIVQVEEVLENSEWVRYYGVVGGDYTGTFKDDELEGIFTRSYYDYDRRFEGSGSWVDGWAPLPNGLNVKLDMPSAQAWQPGNPMLQLNKDEDIWLSCYFSSRRLSGSSVPEIWLNKKFGESVKLPHGINLLLQTTRNEDIFVQSGFGDATMLNDEVQWKTLQCNAAQDSLSIAMVEIPYFDSQKGLCFNLKNLYGALAPGNYCFTLLFEADGIELGESHSIYFRLE